MDGSGGDGVTGLANFDGQPYEARPFEVFVHGFLFLIRLTRFTSELDAGVFGFLVGHEAFSASLAAES
jgi:hypothetical protein